MNEQKYEKIKNYIGQYENGAKTLNILNKLTTTIVYVTYPIFLLILLINRDSRFWKVLLVPAISFILVSAFRSHINLPRPYEVLDIVPIIKKDTKGKSFPSRHVFSVFIIAMTLYYISVPTGVFLMVLGSLIAVIRVVGGVHFPRDVIFGAIIGVLCAVVGFSIDVF